MKLSFKAFHASLSNSEPPAGLSAPLAALWWVCRGPDGWERAHALVQDEESVDAAWIHAHLHRTEGDTDNAAYWYACAGRPPVDEPLAQERAMITSTLLAAA